MRNFVSSIQLDMDEYLIAFIRANNIIAQEKIVFKNSLLQSITRQHNKNFNSMIELIDFIDQSDDFIDSLNLDCSKNAKEANSTINEYYSFIGLIDGFNAMSNFTSETLKNNETIKKIMKTTAVM